MCGRFAVDSEVNDLIEEFVAQGGDVHDWRPSYNIRPTDPIPVVIESVRRNGDAAGELQRRLELARWSLTPSWSKDLKMKGPTFNARSETAATTSMFRASVEGKRALIPVTGYYEWHTDATGPGKPRKTPYFIHDPSGDDFAFAGLYSWWRDRSRPDDDPERWVLTATILTMDAVPHLRAIHDRNPVPLPRELWQHWLDPSLIGDEQLVREAVAAGTELAERLEFYEVAPVTGEGPETMRPLHPGAEASSGQGG
ncbi:SOS response-associated peptidase [Galbitalea sp. SE-J8]|uniref:SOS response-associated peptidase n=1 Tax=Galbitalea sp. SE-J8 TaxID=3054952 RepID=UPI00259C6B9D|nr:SOS response-associated peptidase [Galbitalea sp. SE-J8]MDM4761578.1 SOS response-associated peptidase [Galbitalea sp. SE-J8]